VFSKLSAPEKDAFFGLLDEYFRSRPELFGPGGGQGGGASASTNALGLAAARAIVGGAASTAASSSNNNSNTGNNFAAPSLNRLSANNPYRSVLGGIGGPRKNDDDGHGDNNNESANAAALGRVAAATLAFSGQNHSLSSSSAAGAGAMASHPSPAMFPNRVQGGTGSSIPVPPASAMGRMLGTPGGEVDKLVSAKTSVLGSFRKKAPAAGNTVALPPAFTAPKNTYGPPPVRRTVSTTATPSTTASTTSTNAGTRSVPPAPSQPAEEVEVEAEEAAAETEYAEGEWAEVLYDYNSEDAGDLPIEAGSRVFVTAKSSEDWWTGQVEGQGKEGLFPASYVKLL